MKQLSVYCAHPISGMTWDEVAGYYESIKTTLTDLSFHVYHPMTGKSEIRTDVKEKFGVDESSYKSVLASNHAIFERDKWMVDNCDILYLDLTGNEGRTSIGCMMELAWASYLGRYTVTVMPEDDIHRHAFVAEASDVIFSTPEEALVYLAKFAQQDI